MTDETFLAVQARAHAREALLLARIAFLLELCTEYREDRLGGICSRALAGAGVERRKLEELFAAAEAATSDLIPRPPPASFVPDAREMFCAGIVVGRWRTEQGPWPEPLRGAS